MTGIRTGITKTSFPGHFLAETLMAATLHATVRAALHALATTPLEFLPSKFHHQQLDEQQHEQMSRAMLINDEDDNIPDSLTRAEVGSR